MGGVWHTAGIAKAHMTPEEHIIAEAKAKKRSRLDKLMLGFVVGGAVGSILGVALAPKKGHETRRIVRQKFADVLNDKVKRTPEKTIWHILNKWFGGKG